MGSHAARRKPAGYGQCLAVAGVGEWPDRGRHGVKASNRKDAAVSIHPVDQIPPFSRLLALGLQHVLVMYAGAVAVPLIIGRALNLPADQIAFLVSADLFACGLATLVQTLGLPGIGVRLPVMMGVTFASITPILAMIASRRAAGLSQAMTLNEIYGAVIIAGVVGFLAAPLIGRLTRLFPPVVTGTVILVIGASLLGVGVNWAAGGAGSPDYGAPLHLTIAALVLVVILGITKFAKGAVARLAVLIGVVIGAALSAALGQMDFAVTAAAPWTGLVNPFHFGLPVFEPVSAATMSLVMLVIMIESLGMFYALGRMVDSHVSRTDVVRGFRADALGTIVGGVFNTFPYTSYSQNIGLVGVTNVRSRYVCVAAGCILLALSFSPKLAALVEAVPVYVLGGAGLVMFGMVVATGVRILGGADLGNNRHNPMIVAVSFSVGMIPVVAPHFFQRAPAALSPLLGSGIVLATLTAVLLNLFLNGVPRGESDDA
jgi:NCS2 family nucleobase:cation symporter-2